MPDIIPGVSNTQIFLILHIGSFITWIGSMFVVSSLVNQLTPASNQVTNTLLKLNRTIVTPCMMSTFIWGVTLAVQTQSFKMPWLNVKMGLVILLAAIHGLLTAYLKKAVQNNDPAFEFPSWFKALPLVVGLSTLAVVTLTVLKPF